MGSTTYGGSKPVNHSQLHYQQPLRQSMEIPKPKSSSTNHRARRPNLQDPNYSTMINMGNYGGTDGPSRY